MEIDLSKAPEGATHYASYDKATPWRMVHQDGTACWWNGNAWLPVFGRCTSAAYIAKPIQWDGAGLPPVGTACEVRNNVTGGWDAVDEVLAHTEIQGTAVAVFKRADRVFYSRAMDFRPLPTPEQIAAEERERAIDDLCASIVSHYEAPKMSEHYLGLARALHDAGYRKQA